MLKKIRLLKADWSASWARKEPTHMPIEGGQKFYKMFIFIENHYIVLEMKYVQKKHKLLTAFTFLYLNS